MGQLVTPFLLLFACACAHGRSLSHLIVPSSASVGHVVTSLNGESDELLHLHEDNKEHVKRFFTVVDGDRLVTLHDVSALSGQTVEVLLQRTDRDGSISTEAVQVHVEAAPGDAFAFADAPYTGHITENESIGTEVTGLHAFWRSTHSFPHTCKLQLHGADSKLFDLVQSEHRTALVSAAILDREITSTLHVIVLAHCSATLEARAHVRVVVDDVNDQPPVFTQTRYKVDIPLRSIPSGPILMVSLRSLYKICM